jgi:ADP-dependent NAD(P)H-hydrate dehydratase / NAD(P)H-hydrate epimerase
MKILNVAQMQQAERDSARFGVSTDMLMENAGKAVAEEIRRQSGELHGQNFLILVGPGNNGGDGLVAARYLYDWGAGRVKVYLCHPRPSNDVNLELVKKRGIHYSEIDHDINFSKFEEWLSEATVIVDSVFGTGKNRPIEGGIARVLKDVDTARRKNRRLKLFALDLPSGLNANTGSVDPTTPTVDCTLTLGFPKIGLFNHPGSERAGTIRILDIGIPSKLVDHVDIELLTDASASAALPERPSYSHKGNWGRVMAVTGSINYLGAAYLACSGTIRVGSGLTTLAIGHSLLPILASKLTEVIFVPLPETAPGLPSPEAVNILHQQLPQYDVLLIGCGLGQSQAAADLVLKVLFDHQPKHPAVVADADAINALAHSPEWWKNFSEDAILTPHAGEMSRLTGQSIGEVQANRIEIAKEYAARWNKTIVLKGAYTVIAAPDGRIQVSPFANAGLASAGTRDVLAGAVTGFKAQGLSCFEAAVCGVYVHGLAGELVKAELGDAGMLASDLLQALPLAIRQLKQV